MTDVRDVKEIQAALMTARGELGATTKKLRLVELMTELERNYPEGMDVEQVGEGEICPPLAWEIHADVGNAKILLEEVTGSLEKAAERTEYEVRREWMKEKLNEIKDPSTRALLAYFLTVVLDGEPGSSHAS